MKRWFWLDAVSNKKEFCYYGTDLSEEQVYNTCVQATVDIDNDLKGGEDVSLDGQINLNLSHMKNLMLI